MSIRSWFSRLLAASASVEGDARALYLKLAEQSRQPFFYTECGVPDTPQGRFEMLCLHLFLGLRPVANPALRRAALEMFIDDMDRSLREMGASDTGVGTRVKRMAEAFYGRAEAYRRALDGSESLEEALRRNVYAGASEADASALAEYVRRTAKL